MELEVGYAKGVRLKEAHLVRIAHGSTTGAAKGSASPPRPNPGNCDICGSPDHWKAQCPNAGKKGKSPFSPWSGKGPSMKGPKSGIFGKHLHFATILLGIIAAFTNPQTGYGFVFDSEVDMIFPYDVLGAGPFVGFECEDR